MIRIVYGSSAAIAVVAVLGFSLLPLATQEGMEVSTAQAASPQPGAESSEPNSTADVVRVIAVSPSREDLLRVTTQPVQLEAYERTNVYAKASGFLSKVLVDIGDRVEKDQVLAELWIPQMDQEQLQKTALIEQARAAVEQAQARLGTADALVAAAEAKLAVTKASIDQHEAEVAYRRSEHRRITQLVTSRSVSESLQDEKLNQLQSAEAALATAHAEVESAAADVEVERAQKLQAQAAVSHAQSQLKVAEADLRQTQILMHYAQIRAPYGGLITRRWVDSGDFVASAAHGKSEPLFTMDRVDRLRLVFDVPEAESALIQVGNARRWSSTL